MRTVRASILLGFGVFLVALAPLLRFYAMPHLEKQPVDFFYTDVATGQGKYLDPATVTVKGPELITASRTEKGDVKAGGSTVAVWDIFTNVTNAAGTTIDANQTRWAFDRHSGASVNCCNEVPTFSGQYLAWPFNAPKRTFQYWDPTAKQAFPAVYKGTQKLQGHTFQAYTSVIPPTKIASLEVPGSLVGVPDKPSVTVDEYYSNPNSTALVDRRTGGVLGGSSHQIRTLRLPGSDVDALVALDVNLVATHDSVAGLIKKANDGADKLQLVGTTLPIIALVVGLILVALAIWWDRRRREIEIPAGGVPRVEAPTSVQARHRADGG